MADVEHRHTTPAQAIERRKERPRLLPAENRCRLVQDKQGSVFVDSLGDQHQLLGTDRQLRHTSCQERRGQFHLLQGARRLFGHRAPAQDAVTIAQLSTDGEVLEHRELRKVRRFLVNDRDAAFRGVLGALKAHRSARQRDGAAVGRQCAGDNLHQGRFAGSVFTNDGVNLSGIGGE